MRRAPTVAAAFERMFVPSFGFGGSSQSQQVRGSIHMPLNRNRMYIQGAASWQRSEPFVLSELELDTILLRSTLGYSAAPLAPRRRLLRVHASGLASDRRRKSTGTAPGPRSSSHNP